MAKTKRIERKDGTFRDSHKNWPHKYQNGRKIREVGTWGDLTVMFFKSAFHR